MDVLCAQHSLFAQFSLAAFVLFEDNHGSPYWGIDDVGTPQSSALAAAGDAKTGIFGLNYIKGSGVKRK